MMSLGAQIRQKSSFNCSDKSIAPRPGVSLQNQNTHTRAHRDGVMVGHDGRGREIQPQMHFYIVFVSCSNHKSWVPVNGLWRDLDAAAGSWKQTRGSGPRPLATPGTHAGGGSTEIKKS